MKRRFTESKHQLEDIKYQRIDNKNEIQGFQTTFRFLKVQLNRKDVEIELQRARLGEILIKIPDLKAKPAKDVRQSRTRFGGLTKTLARLFIQAETSKQMTRLSEPTSSQVIVAGFRSGDSLPMGSARSVNGSLAKTSLALHSSSGSPYNESPEFPT